MAFSILMLGILNLPPVLNGQSPDYRFWIREVVLHTPGVRDAPVAQDASRVGMTGVAARRPQAAPRPPATAKERRVPAARLAALS